ncbi:DUF6861 domain-containing protein [Pelomonas sp. KK5]|uniref:DUF6861 domain-containing protein n=1 Tax=Pelomonas sp. KK5 TaxID=1855730 RepID=UPI00118175E0|nr:hypothetical protein [Pelomonas sp. KK5]
MSSWLDLERLERAYAQAGFGAIFDSMGRRIDSGTRWIAEQASRTARVREAVERSVPMAMEQLGRTLAGIDLSMVAGILAALVKDLLTAYACGALAGGVIGGVAGAIGGAGVGAVPGAIGGATVGVGVTTWALGWLGLGLLIKEMAESLPAAFKEYLSGTLEAWGPLNEPAQPTYPPPGSATGNVGLAALRMAHGHQRLLISLLSAMMMYISRGAVSRLELLARIRSNTRLGPAMADWLAANEEQLSIRLTPGQRPQGTGGSESDASAGTARRGAPKDEPVSSSPGAGTSSHKQVRWQEYKDNGGSWDYERWSKVYDANMTRASEANKAVDRYHQALNWGEREVSVEVKVDGQPFVRRLDIADRTIQRGVEYKTGYQSATAENLWELARDKALAKKGWDITWVFRDKASQPLLDALEDAGIKYSIGH